MKELTIEALVIGAFENAKAKGFHDGDFNIPEKLALIHSEISEALEEYRAGEWVPQVTHLGKGGKPEGFLVELADVIIRIGDLVGKLGVSGERFSEIVVEKMAYNTTRSHKHGKVC